MSSNIIHLTCSTYISWNNGWILMFKVSKWPCQSSQHDESICRWRHNPPSGKNLNKQPWGKIENLRNFDHNFGLYRGKIWLWLFHNFFCVVFIRFYTKNFKSFWVKMKAWRWFFRYKMKSKFGKIAVTPSFLLEIFYVES